MLLEQKKLLEYLSSSELTWPGNIYACGDFIRSRIFEETGLVTTSNKRVIDSEFLWYYAEFDIRKKDLLPEYFARHFGERLVKISDHHPNFPPAPIEVKVFKANLREIVEDGVKKLNEVGSKRFSLALL
ncbi:MAG: hypothetical protein QXR60_04025 [Candidatus Nanoarchaeia archaeon]